MARRLVNVTKLSQEEWQAYRMNYLGGSDIAAILGFTPKYRTAISVWLDKTGRKPPIEQNMAMKMGHMLEPVVAQLFAEEHPTIKVQRNNWMLQHDSIDCMAANIDRELICPLKGRGVLEVKTASAWMEKKWTSNTVPDEYMFQLQWYLSITGYAYGYFAVLIGGNDYRSYYVERDEEIIAYIEGKAQEFWQYVRDDVAPLVDGSEASAEALAYAYPPDADGTAMVDIPDDLITDLERLEGIKENIKRLEAEQEFINQRVKQAVGTYHKAEGYGFVITYKPQTRDGGLDREKLQNDYPDIYESVRKAPTVSRPLTIKRSKLQ
jgi:putative phage-type endonuclease